MFDFEKLCEIKYKNKMNNNNILTLSCKWYINRINFAMQLFVKLKL